MPQPLYIKEADVAKLLGHNIGWLHENSKTLEAQYGFPPIDPPIGMHHREAIEAWARERNTRAPSRARLNETSQENQSGF